jgi:hypothetical protein
MNPSTHLVPAPGTRGTLPDAETSDRIYLVKNVSRLRATYQIRLQAMKSVAAGKELVLKVPPHCRFDPSLEALLRAAAPRIRREDLP